MKKLLLLLVILVLYNNSNGQGCSDAGFCTAGAIKPNSDSSDQNNTIGFTIGYGIGERNTTIITPQFEPQFRVKNRGMVQIKVPFVHTNGTLGKANGLGDIIITYNFRKDSIFKKDFMFTIGSRIATGTSNIKSDDNISLPMPYQVSLGSTDLILGAQMRLTKSLSLSIGFQQPIINKNQNGFDSAAFKSLQTKHNLTEEEGYFISSNLKRKGDVMIRLDYIKEIRSSKITAGLLPIYHLGNDEIGKKDNIKEIENSKGLTLNLNAAYQLRINSKLEFSAIAATPLIVRESRPDGLTRAFVFQMGLKFKI